MAVHCFGNAFNLRYLLLLFAAFSAQAEVKMDDSSYYCA